MSKRERRALARGTIPSPALDPRRPAPQGVPFRLVADWNECVGPGYAMWMTREGSPLEGGLAMLYFRCPCGCGDAGSVTVWLAEGEKRPLWSFDGNRAAPSLRPSIKKTSGCGWHGWLDRGVWTTQAPK